MDSPREEASDSSLPPPVEPPKKKGRGRPPKRIDLNGLDRASSVSSSAPSTPLPQLPPPPVDPLAEQELAVLGVEYIDDTLPLPPGESSNGPTSAAKRSIGGPAGALGRAKRPKHVKFSPAKGAKTLARRAMAGAGGGASKLGADGDVSLPNNDFCEVCAGKGHFLCCDGGCLRSFHFQCLDPPLDIDDVPDEDWFCKACRAAKTPPSKPPRGYFRELIYKIDCENPKAFALTPEIKSMYKNVATGPSGDYIDSTEHRPPSKITGRAIGQEDRDGYRIKDKNGRTILCYKCHQSASLSKGRRIISCDFCDQHWHLDCLDPPMTGMPPPTRKWMCPVHSEPALPKKRVPKATSTIAIRDPFEANNGDITIVPRPDYPRLMDEYDEVTVNRVRYQVPEETIILDFWGRVQDGPKVRGLRSPLRKQQLLESFAVHHGKAGGSRARSPGADSIGSDLTSLGDLSDSETAEAPAPVPLVIDTSGFDVLALAVEEALREAENNVLSQLAPEEQPVNGQSPDLATGNGGGDDDTNEDLGSTYTAEQKGKGRVSDLPDAEGPRKRARLSLGPVEARKATRTSPRGEVVSPSQSGARPSESARDLSPLPAEVEVETKEDLSALTHIRKLISAGKLSATNRRALLGFIEGAAIMPKLAFIKQDAERQPWELPWESNNGAKSAPVTKPSFVRQSPADFAASVKGKTPAAAEAHGPTSFPEVRTSSLPVAEAAPDLPAPVPQPEAAPSADTLPPPPAIESLPTPTPLESTVPIKEFASSDASLYDNGGQDTDAMDISDGETLSPARQPTSTALESMSTATKHIPFDAESSGAPASTTGDEDEFLGGIPGLTGRPNFPAK